jgi:CRP-like cAMP-binding protein
MLIDAPLRGVRDRLLALRTMPNYAGLPDASLLFLAERGRDRRFRAGEVLFAAEEPLTRMHFLINGRVRTERRGSPHQVIEAPGAVGVLGVLARESDGWSATAETDTLTVEVPADAFLENLEEDFPLLRNSLRVMATRVLRISGNLPFRPGKAPAFELGEPPVREMTLSERVIDFRGGIRATPYASSNMEALIEMARIMRIEHLTAGDVIFERGAPSTHSFRIHHGVVRCINDGSEHVDVGPGTSVGTLDCFASRPHSFTARAETAVVGYRMELEDSLAVFEMHPGMGMAVLCQFAQRLIAG